MKPIKILAAMVLSGILFAGCTKDSTNTLDATAMTNVTGTKNATAAAPVIVYNLAAEKIMQDQAIQWNSGYMKADALTFEGTRVNGNSLSMQRFEANINTTIQLFAPATLGNVVVAPGFFNYGTFGIQLGTSVSSMPGSSTDPAAGAATFVLNGTYNGSRTGIPVQVMISGEVLLSAQWINNITFTNFSTYTATLSTNVNRITDNITLDMVANAQKTNGTVFITSTSNPELYKIMLTNLQTNVLIVEFSPLPAAPPTANNNPVLQHATPPLPSDLSNVTTK